MALSVSTYGYDDYKEELTSSDALIWAQDLFSLATGIEDMPTDAREERIVTRAVYEMAWYLQTDHENREEYMSKFSGERIGQYNYTKMHRRVEDGDNTDLPAFDFAVEYFGNKGVEDSPMSVSENVFDQPFRNHQDW